MVPASQELRILLKRQTNKEARIPKCDETYDGSVCSKNE